MSSLRLIYRLTVGCSLLIGTLGLTGCHTPLFRGQSPDQADVDQSLPNEDAPQLVRDYALPTGTHYVKIESVGLVTGLDLTGSDPANSAQRESLLSEMKSHDVDEPSSVLASESTAMVLVRGFLPPGVRKGDRLDIEVRVPRRSKTSSLQGGWLMASRLREVAFLGNSVRQGHVDALAQGHVFVNGLYDGEEELNQKVGRVYGGAVALKTRPVGLRLRSNHTSILTSRLVAGSVNGRFHTYDAGRKTGVATPKTDRYIELSVPLRYRNNVKRYIDVVRNISVNESPLARGKRLADLEQRLLEPTAAAQAALQLEAIGADGVRVLMVGLNSPDPEVRFYAAEALGYLDVAEAAPVLGQAAQSERAFRWHALASLSTMDHVASYDVLAELLNHQSAETRYGAFRAMWERNNKDPLIKGEKLNDSFWLHAVDTTADPMIHFSRARRAEVALFGDLHLAPPKFLFAGKKILVKEDGRGGIKVTRFTPGDNEDKTIRTTTKLSAVIKAIAEVGGGYGEILQALTSAKEMGYLNGRLVIDARPRPNRAYRRLENPEEPEEPESRFRIASPLPEMFTDRLDREETDGGGDSSYDDEPNPGMWSRMKGWFGVGDE